MTRNRIIGLLAVVALIAGGAYASNTVFACDNPQTSAQNTAAAAPANASGDAATVTTADVKTTDATGACCPHGKTAQTANATMTGEKGQCATNATLTGGKSCGTDAKTASAKGHCGSGDMMTAEATLTKLARCGININTADAEVLAAKLAEKGCGSYTKEQWAMMVKAAKSVEKDKADAILASAKTDEACSAEACPMTQVAKDLAALETETKKN